MPGYRVWAVWLWGTLVLTSGCSRAPLVKVDGSSTVLPITNAVAEEFRLQEGSKVRIAGSFSGTGGGFKRFCLGELDICNASRPISDEERALCEKNGVEFIALTVAFDGLVVVANVQNDWCDCLTTEQLKAIWKPKSSVAKWSDIDPAWPAEPIRLYGPDTDSGTFDYFTEAIVGEAASSRSDYSQSADDNVLVRGVEGDKYALGYFGMAYYQENKDKLKLLGVDAGDGQCIQPNEETVRNNTYRPLSRPLFIYVRTSSLARPEVREFVKFYVERVGSLVSSVGYVPVPDEVKAKNKQVLEEALHAVPSTAGSKAVQKPFALKHNNAMS